MASDTTVRMKDGKGYAEIYLNLVFQRFAVAGLNAADINNITKYELCSYPLAFIEKAFVPHTTNKSTLAMHRKL